MKLMEFPTALIDIEKSMKIEPNFIKNYIRKGNCHFGMKEYHKALESFQAGLKLEPGNQECLEGQQKTLMTI